MKKLSEREKKKLVGEKYTGRKNLTPDVGIYRRDHYLECDFWDSEKDVYIKIFREENIETAEKFLEAMADLELQAIYFCDLDRVVRVDHERRKIDGDKKAVPLIEFALNNSAEIHLDGRIYKLTKSKRKAFRKILTDLKEVSASLGSV